MAGVGTTGSALTEDGVLDIDPTISLETTWHDMEKLVSMGLVRSIGIRVIALGLEPITCLLLSTDCDLLVPKADEDEEGEGDKYLEETNLPLGFLVPLTIGTLCALFFQKAKGDALTLSLGSLQKWQSPLLEKL
ncbi:hypothetical protein WN944_029231 [Citrus x changshan-huyou]|uniref:Uncharacterized protein n=1 Tax=Citrus x changshan-huyou TaxID=2935761 RepID=A0AAP0Q9N6_9ROSI